MLGECHYRLLLLVVLRANHHELTLYRDKRSVPVAKKGSTYEDRGRNFFLIVFEVSSANAN